MTKLLGLALALALSASSAPVRHSVVTAGRVQGSQVVTTGPDGKRVVEFEDDYGPAYRYGWESRGRYADRSWDEVESDLEGGWESAKSNSRLGWEKAKHATRDAWHRVERAIPGDADNDGR